MPDLLYGILMLGVLFMGLRLGKFLEKVSK